MASAGGRESRCHMLGVLLLEAELQRRLEHWRALRASQLLPNEGLPHLLSTPASPGVAGPPPADLQGKAGHG